ncbi:hypothetical protein [Haloechinothrix alba]|nr:hypothetical protein [Haloechinothrix alba]
MTEHAAMSTIRALRMNMIDNQRGLAVSALERSEAVGEAVALG